MSLILKNKAVPLKFKSNIINTKQHVILKFSYCFIHRWPNASWCPQKSNRQDIWSIWNFIFHLENNFWIRKKNRNLWTKIAAFLSVIEQMVVLFQVFTIILPSTARTSHSPHANSKKYLLTRTSQSKICNTYELSSQILQPIVLLSFRSSFFASPRTYKPYIISVLSFN